MNLLEVFGQFEAPDVVASIGKTFDLMEVAEEEMKAAYARYPRRCRETVRRSFAVLCPSSVLKERGELLYRAHVRQQIDRFVKGENTEEGTDAEVLGVLLGASLRAPLYADAQVAAEQLFAKLFPEQAPRVLGDEELRSSRESWSGAVHELVEAARRKLRVRRI